jgi:hypothetical protein
MLIRSAPVHGPCDPVVVSADVGGPSGIGEDGMTEHRCVNARLREDAGLMRIAGRKAKGRRRPTADSGPLPLVTRCQGALENE